MERIPNKQVDCQGQMNWFSSYQMELYQAFSKGVKLIITASVDTKIIKYQIFWSMKLKIFDKLDGSYLDYVCFFNNSSKSDKTASIGVCQFQHIWL